MPGSRRFLFVTGTDTGVGKTVVAAWLAEHWRAAGIRVPALKPLCSGGRDDALRLRTAQGGGLSLDEINPWHFRASVAPVIAARAIGRVVRLRDVVARLREVARSVPSAPVVLVEGAGGLLSPMGEDFDNRDLLVALRARVIVVGINRLGAVNQMRLTLAALPARVRREAVVVWNQPARPDAASRSNPGLLEPYLGGTPRHDLPFSRALSRPLAVQGVVVRRAVAALAARVLPA